MALEHYGNPLTKRQKDMLQSLPMVDGEPVAWRWDVMSDSEHYKCKGAKAGVYLEDPASLGIPIAHPSYKWTKLYRSPQPLQPITADDVTDEMLDAYLIDDVADWRTFTPELQRSAKQVVVRIYNAVIKNRTKA